MSRYVVDTSAYSHFKRGNAEIVDLIDTAEWIGVQSVVLGELWAGFLRGRRARASVLTYDDHFRHIRRIGSIVLS